MTVRNGLIPAEAFTILGVFEAAAAAIRCIQTFQREVTATLTWRLAIAFDLAPFALVAIDWR